MVNKSGYSGTGRCVGDMTPGDGWMQKILMSQGRLRTASYMCCRLLGVAAGVVISVYNTAFQYREPQGRKGEDTQPICRLRYVKQPW